MVHSDLDTVCLIEKLLPQIQPIGLIRYKVESL